MGALVTLRQNPLSQQNVAMKPKLLKSKTNLLQVPNSPDLVNCQVLPISNLKLLEVLQTKRMAKYCK